jgi:N-acetylmuramoyl-L-alanine amidase
LDPGHGGYDPGAHSQSTGLPTEKQLTLSIGSEVRDLLVDDGYRVVMSRIADNGVAAVEPGDVSGATETPEYVHRDLLARNECADASNASAVVGIHIDSDSDPSAAGSETIYSADRPFARSNLTLANLIQTDVVAAVRQSGFDLSSRGVVVDNSQVGGDPLTSAAHAYGHLVLLGPAAQPENPTPTAMPAALIEPLFLTNPDEGAYAASPAGQSAVAAGIAEGVEAFVPTELHAASTSRSPLELRPPADPFDRWRSTPAP